MKSSTATVGGYSGNQDVGAVTGSSSAVRDDISDAVCFNDYAGARQRRISK